MGTDLDGRRWIHEIKNYAEEIKNNLSSANMASNTNLIDAMIGIYGYDITDKKQFIESYGFKGV